MSTTVSVRGVRVLLCMHAHNALVSQCVCSFNSALFCHVSSCMYQASLTLSPFLSDSRSICCRRDRVPFTLSTLLNPKYFPEGQRVSQLSSQQSPPLAGTVATMPSPWYFKQNDNDKKLYLYKNGSRLRFETNNCSGGEKPLIGNVLSVRNHVDSGKRYLIVSVKFCSKA